MSPDYILKLVGWPQARLRPPMKTRIYSLLCCMIEAAGISRVFSMVTQDGQGFIRIQPQNIVPETEPPRQVLVEDIEQIEEDPSDDKVVVYHNEGVYN